MDLASTKYFELVAFWLHMKPVFLFAVFDNPTTKKKSILVGIFFTGG